MDYTKLAKESEHSHQVAVFAWAALNTVKWPALRWMFAIPNGGARGDNAKSSAIRGAQLKAEGVRKGVSDIFLPFPRHGIAGLFIEMKIPTGKESAEQKLFGKFAIDNGFGYVVCYGYEAAIDVLTQYFKD